MSTAMLCFVMLGACSNSDATAPVEAVPSAVEPPESSSPTEQGKKDESPSDQAIKVIDTDFRPLSVTVEIGVTIEWKQIGDQPHSVSATDGSFDSSPDCGPLDSDKCLGQGDRFSFVFDKAGTFTYYCRVHGLPDGTGMFGTVIVE